MKSKKSKTNKAKSTQEPAGIKEIFALRLRNLAVEIDDFKKFKEKSGLSQADLWRHMRAQGNPTADTIAKVAARFGKTDVEFLLDRRASKLLFTVEKIRNAIASEEWSHDFRPVTKRVRKRKPLSNGETHNTTK